MEGFFRQPTSRLWQTVVWLHNMHDIAWLGCTWQVACCMLHGWLHVAGFFASWPGFAVSSSLVLPPDSLVLPRPQLLLSTNQAEPISQRHCLIWHKKLKKIIREIQRLKVVYVKSPGTILTFRNPADVSGSWQHFLNFHLLIAQHHEVKQECPEKIFCGPPTKEPRSLNCKFFTLWGWGIWQMKQS